MDSPDCASSVRLKLAPHTKPRIVLTTPDVLRNKRERKARCCRESGLDSPNHGHRPIFRLSPTSLATLGRVLFGPRWKAALHRELGIDERLIHRWATGNRPVSPRRSVEICRAVLAKHQRRTDRRSSVYAAMVESIPEPEARAILLEIVSREVEILIPVIRQLARNGNGGSRDAR